MALVFWGLFVVFCGRLTGEIAIIGAVVAALLYLFCWRFLDYSPRKELRALRLLPALVRYLATLLREIWRANVGVLRLILSPHLEPEPQLVTFRTPVQGALARTLLCNAITITPGTITVLAEGDELTVHCLDSDFAEGIENTVFQQQLVEMEANRHDAPAGV